MQGNSAYDRRGLEIEKEEARRWYDMAVKSMEKRKAEDVVLCLDAATGQTLWRTVFPDGLYRDHPIMGSSKIGVYSTNVAAADGRVFARTTSGWTFALEADTGKALWSSPHAAGIHRAVVGGVLVSSSPDLVALDAKTGEKKWEADGVGKGSVCWADGMLYLYSEKDGMAGLASCSPDGLQMKGSFCVPGSQQSWAHPVVTGRRLYLRYDDSLCCFDIADRNAKEPDKAEKQVSAPRRERLPDTRESVTHKFSVGGHEGYIMWGSTTTVSRARSSSRWARPDRH